MHYRYQDSVVKHFLAQLPEEARRLLVCATHDLNFGPESDEFYAMHGHRWPGYRAAVRELQSYADDMSEAWVDPETHEVLDTCPSEDEAVHFDHRAAVGLVFGALAESGGIRA